MHQIRSDVVHFVRGNVDDRTRVRIRAIGERIDLQKIDVVQMSSDYVACR